MISDALLQNYVDEVFMTYDRDRSNSLQSNQLANFFNDVFDKMHNPNRYSMEQAMSAMRQIDRNFDGRASRQQLFEALKYIMNGSSMNNMNYGATNNLSQQGSMINSNYQGSTINQGYGSSYQQNTGGYCLNGGYGQHNSAINNLNSSINDREYNQTSKYVQPTNLVSGGGYINPETTYNNYGGTISSNEAGSVVNKMLYTPAVSTVPVQTTTTTTTKTYTTSPSYVVPTTTAYIAPTTTTYVTATSPITTSYVSSPITTSHVVPVSTSYVSNSNVDLSSLGHNSNGFESSASVMTATTHQPGYKKVTKVVGPGGYQKITTQSFSSETVYKY